jgi:hypothetical protein
MRSPRKSVVLGLTLLSAMLATALGWFWLTYGAYGLNVVLRRAGSYWRTVGPDDPHLSPAMRTALRNPVPAASPGPLVWREVERGYEVGELPVLADGREVDRILLSRIDPAYFRFTARNAADGDRGLDEWEKALPASVLIVNGSYFGLKGSPDTPFVSNGVVLGPTRYDARAGAFVATAETATVEDLSHQSWKAALAGAQNAMVSYPMLIGDDGKSHVASHSRWLANRTFVGEQPDGRIVIGTTREVFFSLDRFADFLRRSPLNLRVALNFDGGPIACQSVRLRGFTRRFYARWEAQVSGDKVRLLSWPRASAAWAMPVVLTVERRPRVKPNP